MRADTHRGSQRFPSCSSLALGPLDLSRKAGDDRKLKGLHWLSLLRSMQTDVYTNRGVPRGQPARACRFLVFFFFFIIWTLDCGTRQLSLRVSFQTATQTSPNGFNEAVAEKRGSFSYLWYFTHTVYILFHLCIIIVTPEYCVLNSLRLFWSHWLRSITDKGSAPPTDTCLYCGYW